MSAQQLCSRARCAQGRDQMQSRRADLACCGRCAGPEAAARIALRQRYRAAVFPGPGRGLADGSHASADASHVSADASQVSAVTGTLLDISPHVAVVAVAGKEQRLTLTA